MYRRQNHPTRKSQLGYIGLGMRRAAMSGKFNPRSNWPSGTEPGLWWSNRGSDLFAGTQSPITAYRENTGVTPASIIGDPQGLWLDRRLGLARGPELAPGGGTFDSATGYTLGADWAISGGVASRPVSTSFSNLTFTGAGNSVVGTTYELSVDVVAQSGAALVFFVASTANVALPIGTGHVTVRLTALAVGAFLIQASGANTTCTLDNLSIKAIPGNHASQATLAARPKKGSRVNLLLGTAALATQNVTTVAAPYTLQFTGSGTVTLSGTSVAGPLVGGGTLTFTPTAGTLTLTVTGSVTLAQLQLGSTATRYQAVVTATNYDTVGFPVASNFDGVDDATATATQAAGVIGNSNMDAYFLMRRNSAAGLIAAFQAAAGTKYIASMTSGGAGAASGLSGTPTFAVNNVAVPGGTATTEGQLHTAMPIGSWLVLAVYNADLSAWTAFSEGFFNAGYPAGDDIAEIILCPAGSAARRAQNYRYLASYPGVGL